MDRFQTATIRNNATGEVRQLKMTYDPKYKDGAAFIWSEGNFACDCNRALFFAEAVGEDDPNISCGDTAYAVLSVIDDDGTVLYEGDDE